MIEGVIDSDPDVRDTYINLRVDVERLTLSDRTSRPAEFCYGVRMRVTG